MTKPNILLFMTDQQRFDSLTCNGSKSAHTPNLDKLAKNGISFTNCYVNNPLCTPSRASILTGKEVPEHGICKLYDNLNPNEILFPLRLQEAGYKTSLVGKLHVCSTEQEAVQRLINDGFDRYDWCNGDKIHLDSSFNTYSKWLKKKSPQVYESFLKNEKKDSYFDKDLHMTTWAAEKTIEIIEEDSNEPFFCFTSVFDPHNPYLDYPIEMEEYIDKNKIKPVLLPNEALNSPIDHIRYLAKHTHKHAVNEITLDRLMDFKFGYDASIAFIDFKIGEIVKTLEKKNKLDNTLIIFTSDHGDMLGDHGLMVKGSYFYEPCVKVPLIAHWPNKIQPTQKNHDLIQSNDISNLILSAAGIDNEKIKQYLPSTHPIRINKNDNVNSRKNVISMYRNSGLSFEKNRTPYLSKEINATMIRDEKYKLVIYLSNDEFNTQGQLFDLENDQNEENNLFYNKNYFEVRLNLTEQIIFWQTKCENKWLNSRHGEFLPKWFTKKTNP